MACSRFFDERSEDLLLEQYASAVSELLESSTSLDISALCRILSAVQPDDAAAGAAYCPLSEGTWVLLFQRRCADALVVGVANGFIRAGPWLELMARLAKARAACPQLAAAVAWALAQVKKPRQYPCMRWSFSLCQWAPVAYCRLSLQSLVPAHSLQTSTPLCRSN